MKGYGDIEAGGLGYGDIPTNTPVLERGYGSPEEVDIYYIQLEDRDIYHNGGAELVIDGLIFDSLAPYQASISTSEGIKYFYSGKAEQSFNLYPVRGLLHCYSPPAPVGSYTLTLRYGLNFSQSTNLPLQYSNDNRGQERYRTRALFPAHYSTGPRACELDELDLGVSVESEPFLISLTDTIGRMFQEIGGSAMTITTAYVPRGSTLLPVETVLGFEEDGFIFVGGELLKYSIHLTNSTLILNQPLKKAVLEGAKVQHYVK